MPVPVADWSNRQLRNCFSKSIELVVKPGGMELRKGMYVLCRNHGRRNGDLVAGKIVSVRRVVPKEVAMMVVEYATEGATADEVRVYAVLKARAYRDLITP